MAGASVAALMAVAAAAAAGLGVAGPAGRLAGGSLTAKRLARAACLTGRREVRTDGRVRPEMGPSIGGRRGAEPPALGPRSGKFLRFVTLDGRFVVKNDIADCQLLE